MRRALRLLKKGGSEGSDMVEMLKTIARPPVARQRPQLTREELDRRAKMVKAWSRHSQREENHFHKQMADAARVRDEAVQALAQISPELYKEAIVVDTTPWPLEISIPLETPPIEGYNPQAAARRDEA